MSQFLSESSEYHSEPLQEIDFDSATDLKLNGSTCDAYKTKWQRRTVFVKRLKKEFRFNPLYLDAFEKEFDIGASINHPSIPAYLAFGRDYIVMEYIDGETLSQMIENNDPWLHNGKNLVRLLNELVDCVDYLHRHKIVHCDIKPDNIMLTSNGFNPVLIDLDKCYTDCFNDTSGHPGRYGLPADSAGRMAMDFRGLGDVAKAITEKIPDLKIRELKKFIDASSHPDISAESLKKTLEAKKSRAGRLTTGLLFGLILLGIVALAIVTFTKKDVTVLYPEKSLEIEGTGAEADSAVTAQSHPEEGAAVDNHTSIPVDEAVTPLQLQDDAQRKAVILDKIIEPRFKKLNGRLERLYLLKSNPEISGEQLLDSIRAFSNMEDEYLNETITIIQETFQGVSEREANRILSHSAVYRDYRERSVPKLNEIGEIIKQRLSL